MKRQREDDQSSSQSEQPLWKREPEQYISAQEALTLRLVSDPTNLNKAVCFKPEFVHQIFPNEALAVPIPSRPLKVEVLYTSASLDVFLRLVGDSRLEGPGEDVLYKIADELPSPICSDMEEFERKAINAFSPLQTCGEKVSEYILSSDKASPDLVFEVFVGTPSQSGPNNTFFGGLQSLMRWFIEGYSPIDVTDERWKLITIFERCPGQNSSAPRYNFVAGATLFGFQRWVSQSESSEAGQASGARLILRICQVLVLPPFQAKGHGSKLLQAVYDYAKKHDAKEVTVEDPNPNFRLLRDVVDIRNCSQHELMVPEGSHGQPSLTLITAGALSLRITEEQLVRCHEFRQFKMLQESLAKLTTLSGMENIENEREALEKPFRLCVKRRLNKKVDLNHSSPLMHESISGPLPSQGGAGRAAATHWRQCRGRLCRGW